MPREARGKPEPRLAKSPTGISGLDEITGGGLPRGRPTLVCGGAGSGKTVLAMEFLVRGAREYGEPGVYMSFEEAAQDLVVNATTLGFDLTGLMARKQLLIDYVHVDRHEIEDAGEYDLDGLFIRLDHAIRTIHAKRVVLDSAEALFSGLPNPAILRTELQRLFRWLKERGMTSIVTGDRGGETLTRHGLEEYISDCVISLDHRVMDHVSTRRLRVVKYRGSSHGTNEYPFLIGTAGVSVLPVTSLGLRHSVSDQRVPTGIPRLDTMLGGKGYLRGSSVLVSGTAGTGKTSIAAHFVEAACRRGERALYFAFEESADQIRRNMLSIGIDLAPLMRKGLLRFHASRPSLTGLEAHLAVVHREVAEFAPKVVVVDPVSAFDLVGSILEIRSMLMRMVDHFKTEGITAIFTSLTTSSAELEATDAGISSLMDTWLLLRQMESAGERNRGLYVLKCRGTAHSNQIREFHLTDGGVQLTDVYVGAEGVLTGSARLAQEARDAAARLARAQEIECRRRDLERKRQIMDAQILVLRADFESEERELETIVAQDQESEVVLKSERMEMAKSRQADAPGS